MSDWSTEDCAEVMRRTIEGLNSPEIRAMIADQESSEIKMRRAIIGAINLLSGHAPDTILGSLPAGGIECERMCEVLVDHLRVAIGLEPKSFRGAMNDDGTPAPLAGDESAAHWLSVTDAVREPMTITMPADSAR